MRLKKIEESREKKEDKSTPHPKHAQEDCY